MAPIEDSDLFSVFLKYCHFGTRQNGPVGESIDKKATVTTPQLDGSKFAKLVREAGLIDGQRMRVTEVDILFNRVKDRNERRISFLQFRKALQLLAEKKFGVGTDKEEMSGEKAEGHVIGMVKKLNGPLITPGSTLPEQSQIIDRLMEGPITYISKSPKEDTRPWKDELRRSPSSPASRRSSSVASPNASRKSSVTTPTPLGLHKERLAVNTADDISAVHELSRD